MVDADERELGKHVTPLEGTEADFAGLLQAIGGARYVLLGEATHGTHEFYTFRAELTKRLIRERGFTVVAVEADWPDAYQVHRFAQGEGPARGAEDALASFERFPLWMWRNEVVREFVGWLRRHNERSGLQAGFYGIDLYSLHSSMQSVLAYLEQHAPEQARQARERYGCFESFGGDPERYGYATTYGLPSCEEAVIEQLMSLRERRASLSTPEGLRQRDELFFAEQNARVVTNAEQYYRAMFRGGTASWNLRDTHMADTIDALCTHVGERGEPAKVVVWAHNSHLGDARATELGDEGELNVGQLMRERHPGETFLLGFSTFEGEVTAASEWDGPAEQKRVRPALRGSHEERLHRVGIPRFWLSCATPTLRTWLEQPRLQRAIGVVYLPDSERTSHYYHTTLARQFDALVHFDRTTALSPLAGHPRAEADELPESYPTGL